MAKHVSQRKLLPISWCAFERVLNIPNVPDSLNYRHQTTAFILTRLQPSNQRKTGKKIKEYLQSVGSGQLSRSKSLIYLDGPNTRKVELVLVTLGKKLIIIAWGAASLGSIDVALWDVAFSPSGLSSESGCILAGLTSNMDLSLWAASKNCLKGEWVKVCEVTPFLLETFAENATQTMQALQAQIT
ncbi:hypothetical protein H0H93_001145, partial [Arthromyces matolae]